MSEENKKGAQSIFKKYQLQLRQFWATRLSQFALYGPLVVNLTLGIVLMPQDDKEECVLKKTLIYIQKCMICKKSW